MGESEGAAAAEGGAARRGGAPSGGELARLDELAAVTREYALECYTAISLRVACGVGAVLVAAVALCRVSAVWGALAGLATTPVAVALLALDRRRGWAVDGRVAEWSPADRLERQALSIPGPLAWVPGLLYGAGGVGMVICVPGAHGVHWADQPVLTLAAAAAVLCLYVASLAYLLLRDRRKHLLVFAFLGAQVTVIGGNPRAEDLAIGLSLALVLPAGFALDTLVRRRRLRRLERRMAFLREYAR